MMILIKHSLGQWQKFLHGSMKQRIGRIFSCFIIAACIVFFHPTCESYAQSLPLTKVKDDGIYAADFTLKDLNGVNIRLSSFKGKMILLHFMTTWCTDCMASVPYLKRIYTQYHNKGLVMININIQEKEEKVAAYSTKNSLPYPTVLDTEGTVARSYGVVGVPARVLIDRNGRIICWNCRSLDQLLENNLR